MNMLDHNTDTPSHKPLDAYTLYILANGRDPQSGPLFMDMTQDIESRLCQHRSGRAALDMFRIDHLVYQVKFTSALEAQRHLRALKSASREWLTHLIERQNPYWQDVSQPLEKGFSQKVA